jgi:multicomponent Na+:H+ antiporter subunit D
MTEISSFKPLGAVLISLTATILILLTGERRRNLREFWSITAAIGKFLLVFSMIPYILQGNILEYSIISIAPGLKLQFKVDSLGLFFALVASGLWVVTSFYSIGYIRGTKSGEQTRYFACFALVLSATMGIAFAANLLTLFIFYEILSLSTYPLVVHKQTDEAIKAGRKYLVYILGVSALLLVAIALTYRLTGTVDFTPGGFMSEHLNLGKGMLGLLFACFIIGFGTKAAIMPFHEWLPTAMVAPTPVSALLHAVAVVKAGVFGIFRIVLYVFGPKLLLDTGWSMVVAYLVSCTIIISAMIALAQDNLKRRLAFSTINSLSLIILGVVLLSESAVTGGILHLANHAFMKITLFFCAGAIYVKTHKVNISELDGIGRQMPWTMAAFTIAAFGLAGLPPICGFISKWYLALGAITAPARMDEVIRSGGKEQIFLAVILVSALLDIAIFFPIIYRAFFKGNNAIKKDEASLMLVLPLVICAAMTVTLGIAPNAFMNFFQLATDTVNAVLK